MIELREVSKTYGDTPAIDGLSLAIGRGELVALIGASGSGKSTLLKMINRLVEHDRGMVLFQGEQVRSFRPEDLRRRMGYAIQSIGLFPHWSVARNVATVPVLLGWPAARIAARVDELLALLGLDPALYRGRYPHQLSGGQQQRVGVARGLAVDPNILLMDEPFGAVDPIVRRELQQELVRLQQELDKTVVFVTHDIEEAFLLGDQVVILQQGGFIAQVGSPKQILSAPANDFVASFIGAERGKRALHVESHGGNDVLVDSEGRVAGVLVGSNGPVAADPTPGRESPTPGREREAQGEIR